jgi:NAD(P)-dependent dehydrogenase (short-subunit alcohol dehydrogenase family)
LRRRKLSGLWEPPGLILAVRSVAKGEDAARRIRDKREPQQGQTIDVWELDLASFESVKRFAACASFDIVVQNAGIAPANWDVTDDGYEKT